MRIRPSIVAVLGHVDVGKTLLLDKIRGTAVAYREPGMITQHVGLSFVPWQSVVKFAGPLIDRFKLRDRIWIPGYLFVDTPGHAAFANLRRRGGSVADLAILVVDITRGVEEQTIESLTLIKARGVPFVIAANKIDRIYGWKPHEDAPFIVSYVEQDEYTQGLLEDRILAIISQLEGLGVEAERYDRVRDFTKQVPIVPTSAITGEGVADLLVVLAGISQRFTKDKLAVSDGPGKGVIMEVREERGLGTVVDVLLYDGVVRRGDVVVFATTRGTSSARIRGLIMPKPLEEMRDPEDKYMAVEEVRAAAGVRIVADGLEGAVAGSPIYVVEGGERVEEYSKLIREEVAEIRIETDREGVVAKADTLGTLESLVLYLRHAGVPVRYADIGAVSKRDLIEAMLSRRRSATYGVILAFNVRVPQDIEKEALSAGVRIFSSPILYRLVEDYLKWAKEEERKAVESALARVVRPGKVLILPGFVFRRSNPAIVGVKVLGGIIRPGYPLVRKDGRHVGRILQIQSQGKPIDKAVKGMEVAISIQGDVIVGRHIKEGDELYVEVPEHDVVKLMVDYRKYVDEDEVSVLKELLELRRHWKKQPA